jgi:hypothetical protein
MYDFFRFFQHFCALETPKSKLSIFFKIGPIYQKNWSVNQNLVRFIDMIQNFERFECGPCFHRRSFQLAKVSHAPPPPLLLAKKLLYDNPLNNYKVIQYKYMCYSIHMYVLY